MKTRQLTLAALVACLIAANFVNPLYPFPFENNLAFVSFVGLEESAADVGRTAPGRGRDCVSRWPRLCAIPISDLSMFHAK